MSLSVEKTLEIRMNVPRDAIERFTNRVLDCFGLNPYGIRQSNGSAISEPGSDRFTRFPISMVLTGRDIENASSLKHYMRGNGFNCDYLETD